MNNFRAVIENPLATLFIVSLLGLLVGRISFRNIRIGSSGALIIGLVFGYLGFSADKTYFNLTLVLFLVAVGLLASEYILVVLRKYGGRFAVLGLLVTGVGAGITYLMTRAYSGIDPSLVAGTYTGALTSSPGLAAALESTIGNPEMVTIGHALAYPFGVLIIVFFMQFMPKLSRMNMSNEMARFSADFSDVKMTHSPGGGKPVVFSIIFYLLALVVGVLIGGIKVNLPGLGSASLGNTGGALIAALVIGYFGQKRQHFTVSRPVLSAIRELTLTFFLAVVGIMAGGDFVSTVSEYGGSLILITLLSGLGSIFAGYVLARKVWKMNWIVLAGALCGGMTSTPGLGIAIDTTGTDEVGVGYGAVYPVAIIGMIVFTKLLHYAV